MEDARKKALIESLIFLSGSPVTISELKEITGIPQDEINSLAEELISEYGERGGGVLIARIAGGFQMATNPEFAGWTKKLKASGSPQKLSLPALETLAIIAYKQPLTKAEVEALRGVNSDGVVKNLLDRRLIKIIGRKEAPGKPLLYGTTREFLEYFGLKDLTGLPTLKDMEREGT
jgi:segregation and condensation protein B